jgi:hypothetical protein
MYINGKMIYVETIPGMGGWGIKENGGGVNSNMIFLIYCKNFYECHNVPPHIIAIKILHSYIYIYVCIYMHIFIYIMNQISLSNIKKTILFIFLIFYFISSIKHLNQSFSLMRMEERSLV